MMGENGSMIGKQLIDVLKNVMIIFLTTVLAISCGNGTESGGTITVNYNLEVFPSSIDHVHYSGWDGNGNKIYGSSELPMSDSHTIDDVPKNMASFAIEYHTSTHEKLHKDVQAISFSESAHIILSPQYHAPEFDPKRLAVVDSFNNNLLVRGNFPFVKKTGNIACHPDFPEQEHCFALSELTSRMKELIKDFDIDQYEIIDVSLIDNQGTIDELTAEANAIGLGIEGIACGSHNYWPPYQGCEWDPKTIYNSTSSGNKPWGLVWWPVYACNRPDPCNKGDTDTGLHKFHFFDASQFLRELLTTSSDSGKNRLIYFHCVQGTDRTGSLHITYLIDNNPKMTFEEAIRRATIGARQGSDDQQLDPPLVPMCTYVGLAYRYCQEKYKDNPERCNITDDWFTTTSLCRR